MSMHARARRPALTGVLRRCALGPLSRVVLLLGFLVGVFAPVRTSAREAENEAVEKYSEELAGEAQVRTTVREQHRRFTPGGPGPTRSIRERAPACMTTARVLAWARPQIRLPRLVPPLDEDPPG